MYPADTLTTEFTYTYTGKVTGKTEVWSSAVPKIITTNTYDGADRLVKSTVRRGLTSRTMTMSYDAVGRLTKQSAGDVLTRSMAYDVHGWLKTISTELKKSPAIIDTAAMAPRTTM